MPQIRPMQISKLGVVVSTLLLAAACKSSDEDESSDGETSGEGTSSGSEDGGTADDGETGDDGGTGGTGGGTADDGTTGDDGGTGGTGETTGDGGTTGGGECGENPAPPGSDECPAECTGGCDDANLCTIDCIGEKACEMGGPITCPPDYACEIVCDGLDSCDSLMVTCPEGYACTLVCTGGKDACGDVHFVCDGASSCTMQCGPHDQACQGAYVDCGAGACSATCDAGVVPPTMMNCDQSCDCQGC